MTWVSFHRGIKSAETLAFHAPLISGGGCATPSLLMSAEKGFDSAECICRIRMHPTCSMPSVDAVGEFLPASDRRVRGTIAAVERASNAGLGTCCGTIPAGSPMNGNRSKALSRLQPLARRRLCSGRRDRQGAGAVRSRGCGGERPRAIGGGIRFRRTASNWKFPASPDPHRADQYRAQSQRCEEAGRKAGDAAVEVDGTIGSADAAGATSFRYASK